MHSVPITIPGVSHNFTLTYIHSQLSSFAYSTKLTHQSTQLKRYEPKFNNCKCLWKHRPDRFGGGLRILVKSDLQYDEINLSSFKNGGLEVQAIDRHLVNGTKLSVLNFYNPNKDVRLTEFQH